MSWSAAVWESRPPEWDHDLAAASLFSLTHHRSSAPSIAPPSLADSSSTFASDEVQRVQDATSKMSIQQGPPVVIGLKLGKRTYFEQNAATNYGPKKRFDQHIPQCQVHGCKADLSGCKPYHRRHKVCEMHSKTPKNVVAGQEQRFCQQCSRFHLLTEFDEGKRSCRRRLAGHNERRRKPQNEGVTAALAASMPFFSEGFNAKNAMDFMVAQAQQREAIMDGSYLGSTWHKASADYSQQLKQHLLLLNQQQQHQRTNSNDNNKNSSSSSSNLASAAHDQLLKCRVATPMEAHGALSLLSAELCSSSASSIKTPAMVHQHNLGQFAEPLDSSSSMFDS